LFPASASDFPLLFLIALFVHDEFNYDQFPLGEWEIAHNIDLSLKSAQSIDRVARAEMFYRLSGWTETGRKDDGQIVFQKNI
jgi:hypothetical protein